MSRTIRQGDARSRKRWNAVVYCRCCKGSYSANDRDPGCLCGVGWETRDGAPCKVDGTPIAVSP